MKLGRTVGGQSDVAVALLESNLVGYSLPGV